ncbi:MAG: HEAT repeat domain-containing protein [Planctomycetota bacterium]
MLSRCMFSLGLLALTASAQGDSVAELTKKLESPYSEVRVLALQELAGKGETAAPAADALVAAMQDPILQLNTRKLLASLGDKAHGSLGKGLSHENARVRRWCLELLGTAADRANVEKLTTDKDTALSILARRVIAALDGKSVGALPDDQELFEMRRKQYGIAKIPAAQTLRGLRAQNLEGARVMLAKAGDNPVPVLLETMQNGSDLERARAVIALRGNAAAGDKLVEALNDRSYLVRNEAALALADLASRYDGAVPALIRALDGKTFLSRMRAAEALSLAGDNATAALPNLRHWMTHGTGHTALASALAIWRVGGEGAEALALFVDAISADEPWYREAGARNLGRMGAAAKETMPLLKGLYGDTDAAVARTARAAVTIIEAVAAPG